MFAAGGNVPSGRDVRMLDQGKADELIAMAKRLVDDSSIRFPAGGEAIQLQAKSSDERESFIFDVNRKGRLKLTKCTYQERYAVVEILIRLDIDGPPHQNPDGAELPCPHLHIFREGAGTKWAYPLPAEFTDTSDLVKTLREFLRYCNVSEVPPIQKSIN
jgi:Family of unknown function (DUF6978)